MSELPELHLHPGDRVSMVDASFASRGRTMRYSISDNVDAEVWALNVHGFFAGGGVYWRESTRLAAKLGLRVVNPNLPGFAGSTALHWDDLTMSAFAASLVDLLDHLGVDKVLILGHSMGGAVSVQFAHDHPDRTLGLVYRDGVATSSWKQRSGILKALLDPISPDVGDALDIALSVAIDIPDLLVSRLSSMLSTAAPDIRQNARKLLDTAPVAAMLLFTDLTPLVEELGRRRELPVLPMWGRFDRLVPPRTALEFAETVRRPVHWIWGGHSWMVPRPATTLRHLVDTDDGRAFLHDVGLRAGRAITEAAIA
jgi:pimeloyl-ACP methyl ester carboxylesterase